MICLMVCNIKTSVPETRNKWLPTPNPRWQLNNLSCPSRQNPTELTMHLTLWCLMSGSASLDSLLCPQLTQHHGLATLLFTMDRQLDWCIREASGLNCAKTPAPFTQTNTMHSEWQIPIYSSFTNPKTTLNSSNYSKQPQCMALQLWTYLHCHSSDLYSLFPFTFSWSELSQCIHLTWFPYYLTHSCWLFSCWLISIDFWYDS